MQNILECCQYLVYIWVVVGTRVENCEDQREWLMGVWTPRQDPAVLFCIALVQCKTLRQHCSGGLCNTFSLITAYGCDFTMYEVWTDTQRTIMKTSGMEKGIKENGMGSKAFVCQFCNRNIISNTKFCFDFACTFLML